MVVQIQSLAKIKRRYLSKIRSPGLEQALTCPHPARPYPTYPTPAQPTLAHPCLEEHPSPALAKTKGRYLAKYRRPPLKMGPLHSSPTHPIPTQPNSPNLNPIHPHLNVHLFLHLAKIKRRYLAK